MDAEQIPMIEHRVVQLDMYRLIRDVREIEAQIAEATGLTPELRRALQEPDMHYINKSSRGEA